MAVLLKSIDDKPHHEQNEICTTRAKYRQGRKFTAVKVYTVNDESLHLLVQGVPSIGLQFELEKLFKRFGRVLQLAVLPDYPSERFCEAYMVKYESLQSARFAKKQLDGRSFFGGVLHICYAPELETDKECLEKLAERRQAVAVQLRKLASQDPSKEASHSDYVPRKHMFKYNSIPPSTSSKHVPPPPAPMVGPQKPPEESWKKPMLPTIEAAMSQTATTSSAGLSRTLVPRQVMVKRIVFHDNKTKMETLPTPPKVEPPFRKRTFGKSSSAATERSLEDTMIAIRRKVIQMAVPNPPVTIKRQKKS